MDYYFANVKAMAPCPLHLKHKHQWCECYSYLRKQKEAAGKKVAPRGGYKSNGV